MAGHSKWANIKHRKASQDAKRGKIFTKLIRELTVAAKEGGAEVADNPRLRAAVDKALSNNMTRDTIERAVARGAGTNEVDNMEEIVYEGYGPGGVAVLVECLSDNRNRTVGEVRHAFTKNDGNLGTSGSVAYLFQKRGYLIFSAEVEEDQLLEAALEAGAEDVVTQDDGSFEVFTEQQNFLAVKEALAAAGFEAEQASVAMLPDVNADVTDLALAEKIIKLVDMLEDLDDVQEVYSNVDFSAEVMEQLG
ncbi:MAG TPA: YebC/PmpR family DNA-binding transcriptional regulator [Marinospirillum sp.]|uniref:YebC/PmpR family DNA-binding transcriptional regulator n=1 Tax=Marinospirillum sp. TaxID=2183934 RepID=UPI002B468A75|nr:YebC/PmpR family DNA-binding transcriptional regulator [Marinospirillum sp.]HKM15346.1 YebC/PmpR family DNA-binding transcriptional regulator [Marinospirillum sp.]